jgi:hypothetical protein
MGSFALATPSPTFTKTVKEYRMNYPPALRTLGLAALGLAAFAITLGAAGVSTSAKAQIQTYYHAGAWDAFSGRNDKGGAVCGIGNTNPSDGRRLSIHFDIGGTDTVLSASKPDWAIPDNTPVRVVMQIGLNTPWTEQATGRGHDIEWSMDRAAMQWFDQQFRGASSMTLTFPDGNEPPWTITLAGSSAISDAFGRCIRDLTRQVQAQQPGYGAAPPQGGAPGATQPFAPQAGSAPAPQPQPSGTQPDDGQPGGGQPGGGQPGGGQPNGPQPDGGQPNGGQPGATQPNAPQPAH